MPNLNSVHLMGNLTRDPELKYTQGGTAVCSFGLAINETWTGNDGQKKQKTVFVDLTAWARRGEVINEYFKKGDPIFIEGRLDFQQWDDRQTGAKRSKLAVIVDNFQFLRSKSDGQGGQQGGDQGYYDYQNQQQDARNGQGGQAEYIPPNDSNVPF